MGMGQLKMREQNKGLSPTHTGLGSNLNPSARPTWASPRHFYHKPGLGLKLKHISTSIIT